MKQVSEKEIRRERQINRIYNPPGNKNGTLFFVTVNSNKVIDPSTHIYRKGQTNVSYETTVDGMRELERTLNRDLSAHRASIEDYSIEIGARALRLHTHFTVLIQHSSAEHGEYQLDRDQIERIFKEAWGIKEDENIHVNIMSSPYSPETENKFRDYMNQYIGPNIETDTHLHIVEGPRYTDSRTSKLIKGQGLYPMSREPARDRLW